ncbi:hypothetical protein D9613_007918 [Agrocybe pediades]|uniref:Uncharacterized protein n=1 Tax=Agrocybe pediades TaxID=84607 RepID=A0A8H4VKG7_9AGAR|nr:hypothetical protein D9613_007918 [Agrocybe pediades]
MFTTFVCATVLALLPILPAHSAPVTPQAFAPPSGFSITSFGVNGSGCPPGSATYSFNGDKTAVNVTFSEFYASAGPGIPISENRKNCQLTFAISVPSGLSYGIASTEARGYYYLDPSVTASQ